MMFARALSMPAARTLPTPKAAAAAASAAPAKCAPPAAKPTLTQRIQARVVPLIDKAAVLIAGSDTITTNNGSNGSASTGVGSAGGKDSAAALLQRSAKVGPPSASDQGPGEVPADAAAAADDSHSRTAAARAKLKGLSQRAVGAAGSGAAQ